MTVCQLERSFSGPTGPNRRQGSGECRTRSEEFWIRFCLKTSGYSQAAEYKHVRRFYGWPCLLIFRVSRKVPGSESLSWTGSPGTDLPFLRRTCEPQWSNTPKSLEFSRVPISAGPLRVTDPRSVLNSATLGLRLFFGQICSDILRFGFIRRRGMWVLPNPNWQQIGARLGEPQRSNTPKPSEFSKVPISAGPLRVTDPRSVLNSATRP